MGAPWIFSSASTTSKKWTTLSAVSQVYGAIGSVISSFALVGVGISLYLQAREARASREMAYLSMQLELLKFGLDDPVLTTAMEPPHGSRAYSLDDYKRDWYVHSVMRQKFMAFSIGALDADVIRKGMSLSFRGEAFRRYWEDHGNHWMGGQNSTDPMVRKFRKIVEAEYQKAVEAGPPLSPTSYFRPPNAAN
ncbi:DUF6082 family protein [Streptomyces mirabilis]|uniref:DUF6082 family protein n=1 Tax=Streptomyces mirabilis TaxID=68239 RepID=UPI0037151B1E